MEVLRTEIESRLGFEVGDMQFKKSVYHAEKKLDSMIMRHGDANGCRRGLEYLAGLVCEDIKAGILSDATLLTAANIYNTEKERPKQDAQMDNPIVNVSAAKIKQNLQYGGRFL